MEETDHATLMKISQRNSQDLLHRSKQLASLPQLSSAVLGLSADGSNRLRTFRQPTSSQRLADRLPPTSQLLTN